MQTKHSNKQKSQSKSFAFHVLCGAASGCTSVIVTNPIEVCKTRMQLQGELGAAQRPFKHSLQCFTTILKNEGIVHGLEKGLYPALMYQLAMQGSRLGTYPKLKKQLISHNTNYTISTFVAGGISGIIGGLCSNPFHLIKVRLQSQADGNTMQVGTQHRYNSIVAAFRGVVKEKNSIFGLWYMSHSNMIRAGIGSSVQLSTFDNIRKWLIKEYAFKKNHVSTNFVASFTASLFVVTAIEPIDVITTRLFNAKKTDQRYNGVIDCAVKTMRKEGIRGLYKGWSASYFRAGPHTVIVLMLWSKYEHLFESLFEYFGD
eukprot:547297_1